MKKNILLAAAMIAASCNILAQRDSLNAVISVENDYTPVVTKATKRTFTPSSEKNGTTRPLELEYSRNATPFRGFTSERDVKDLLPGQKKSSPGYARLGYGTGNNTDAVISYEQNISDNGKLRTIASHRGYNTKIDGIAGKWDSRMFSSWVNADYTHRFNGFTLGLNGEFGNNVFNYQKALATDKQNNKRYKIAMEGTSLLSGPVNFTFNVGYSRSQYGYLLNSPDNFSENKFNIGALVKYEITDNLLHDINLGVDLNNYIYRGMDGAKNFLSADFNPYATVLGDNYRMKIGANINIATSFGSRMAIAPDFEIETTGYENFTMYGSIKGGRQANSIERLEQLSPYWFGFGQLKPSYTIADITAGIRIAREALSFNFYLGYSYTKDDLLSAAYYDEVIDKYGDPIRGGIYSLMALENTGRVYVGTSVGYDYEGWLKASLAARYNRWKCSDKYLIGTKPEAEIEFNIEARIIENLYTSLAYNFATYSYDAPSKNKNEVNLRATYKLSDNFGAFVEGNNLLNQEYVKYAGYYEQGINVLLGVSATF